MRKYFILLLVTLTVVACKNQGAEEAIDESLLQEISADYYFDGEAGVLLGKNFIYGVKINSKAEELGKQIEEIKVEPTDMVPVVVKGVINDNENTEEVGWEQIVSIAEIVSVGTKPSSPDVKLE